LPALTYPTTKRRNTLFKDDGVKQALLAIKAANKRSSLGDDWSADDASSWPYVKLDTDGRLVELCVLDCVLMVV
jgi:hypothetical protein